MSKPTRIPLLTAEESRAIADQVLELRPHWTQRIEELPSFTLGASAYLDVPVAMAKYLLHKNRTNRLLKTHFEPMYGALIAALSRHFDAPFALSWKRALPGFHIYLYHPAFAQLQPSIHFDLQDVDLALATPERPDGDRCSFTLPIQLPSGGAGLYVWDLDYREVSQLPHHQMVAVGLTRTRTFHAYTAGELFLHTGDQLHQIADHLEFREGDIRITMQGHGHRTESGWELYW